MLFDLCQILLCSFEKVKFCFLFQFFCPPFISLKVCTWKGQWIRSNVSPSKKNAVALDLWHTIEVL